MCWTGVCVVMCVPPPQILWTFSIYLESVAIMPQLYMISKTGEAETITSHYLFALGSYRGLYIVNWIFRYYTEGFYDLIAVVAGCVQTALYCDFFYLYITKGTPNIPPPLLGFKIVYLPSSLRARKCASQLCVYSPILSLCSYERQGAEAASLARCNVWDLLGLCSGISFT